MQNIDNEQLRERVDQRVKRQKKFMNIVFFVISLLMFVLFVGISIAMLTGANLSPELVQGDSAPVTGAFIMLSMGWITTLVFQGLSLLADVGVLDRSIRDRIITQEIGRQFYEQAVGDYEKPKRQSEDDAAQYAISDDGELVEVDEESRQKAVRN